MCCRMDKPFFATVNVHIQRILSGKGTSDPLPTLPCRGFPITPHAVSCVGVILLNTRYCAIEMLYRVLCALNSRFYRYLR